jgi:hypothetical protein
MPIDPLLGLITVFGDAHQLVVGVAKRLKNLFGNGVPALAGAPAPVFNMHFVLHGAILACPPMAATALVPR